MNTKSYCLALCCLLTVSATYAENIRKKVKNAAGIEVTYQSSYKGKTAPGQLLMKVMGNEVSLTQIPPKEEADKKEEVREQDKAPVIGSYIDYQACKSYKRAELPDGRIISAATPFEFGKGFKEVGTDKVLGLDCKILQTIINSNTIRYGTLLTFRSVVPHRPMSAYRTVWF